IQIVRAFVRLRELLATHQELARKLAEMRRNTTLSSRRFLRSFSNSRNRLKSWNASPSDSRPSDLDFSLLCLAAIWRLFAFIETAHRCKHAPATRGLASHKPPPSSLLHGQAQSCWHKNLSPLVRRHLTLHRSPLHALKSRNAMIHRHR